MNITLRSANKNDTPVLEHWDQQQHNIDSDPNDDWEWVTELNRNPPWREQLIAELDGRPLGFVQIIDAAEEETHYWGEVEKGLKAIDIWIGEAEDLGKGYGSIMMKLAISRCFEGPEVKGILIDPLESNLKARRFYERLGFKFVENKRFGEDDTAVYLLSRNDWETHLNL
jgi:aminoglycoside 6'-N-acetyltransferase